MIEYPITLDTIDKWLFDSFGILAGACSSTENLRYSVARRVAESLWPKQPSEDLEKAAEEYTQKMLESWRFDSTGCRPPRESFIAGAQWQKEQMKEMRWRKSSFGGLVPLSVIREMDADGKYYYHLGVTCPAGMEYVILPED